MAVIIMSLSLLGKVLSPGLVLGPGGYWLYSKRRESLNHPVFQRGLLHLQNDQRIVDFCGEGVKPGWWISVNGDPTENYVKFSCKVKGPSGDLGTTIIGDFLTHRELGILEQER